MRILDRVYWYPERGIMDCNSYLVDDDLRLLIDPGLGSVISRRNLLKGLKEDGFEPPDVDLIVNTHSHPDHAGANRWFKRKSNARIAIHRLEDEFRRATSQLIVGFFSRFIGAMDFQVDVHLPQTLRTGEMEFEVLLTPGHTPGSVSLYCDRSKLLVSGDVIFSGSIGRTDFPGGSWEALKNSLDLLSKLEVEFLLPGHGNILKGKEPIGKNFEFVKRVYL